MINAVETKRKWKRKSFVTYGESWHETKQYSLSCCNGFHAVLFLVFHLGSFSFIEAMEKEIINL